MTNNKQKTQTIFSRTVLTVLAIAAIGGAVACSSKPKTSVSSVPATVAKVQPVVFKSAMHHDVQPAVFGLPPVAATEVKAPLSKQITYRSRNYGVSFAYPRQYAYVSAKTVAEGDSSLHPKSDGHEGQFTLARIDVPKGFYPDTDFESAYFMLSLNQELSESDCRAALGSGNVQLTDINGQSFNWMETSTGGKGNAATLRNYVAFANDTCYEIELGVKTRNEDGLARELNPERVMERLNVILQTVKIEGSAQKVVAEAAN